MRWLAAFLLCAACQGGSTTPAGPDAAASSVRDAAPTESSLADRIAPDVVGSYALRQTIAAIQDVPILGPSEATTVSIGLATIARSGDSFTIEERGCRVQSTGGPVDTIIPDAIPRNTPALVSPLTFAESGETVTFERAEAVILIGVTLDDPWNDELPADGNDSRVFDQDGDGNPGVTVKVNSSTISGDIFVVQRNRSSARGTLEGPGQLSGLLADASDQSVVGATNPLLDRDVVSMPHDDPSRSTVELIRLDGTYDCERVVAEADQLF